MALQQLPIVHEIKQGLLEYWITFLQHTSALSPTRTWGGTNLSQKRPGAPPTLNLSLTNLMCCHIMDSGLEHLQPLISCTNLNPYNCTRITEAGLAHLRPLPSLTSNRNLGYHTTGTGTMSTGAPPAPHLSHTNLDLIFCKITGEGLAHLRPLTTLTALHCSCYLMI